MARRGGGGADSDAYPAPLRLKGSTHELPTRRNQQRIRRRSDTSVPWWPQTSSLQSAPLLPPTCPSRAASSSARPPPVLGAVRPLIPVTRPPKVIWPTSLSGALWDIWALRPVFWRAICAPPPPPPLLTAQRTTFVDLVFVFFCLFSCCF